MANLQIPRICMVKQIEREIKDKRVLDIMARVPREMFVPTAQRCVAYDDRPLPIGLGQTISQPLMVAIMTEALDLKVEDYVLEVGSGSGYQAAILAELAGYVISVERHPELIQKARDVLSKLGYKNVVVHQSKETTIGWPLEAPYDAIVVTAGAPDVPSELVDQLADGGRLVIPVGPRERQQLLKLVKQGHQTITQMLGTCTFVPLVGPGAWDEYQVY